VGRGSNFMGRGGHQMATARIRGRRVSQEEDENGIIPEPEETEEDRRRYEAMLVRMEEDRRLALEAGERLPSITENIWGMPED
jgi:hypothetical protein